jgi:hypothetical protein
VERGYRSVWFEPTWLGVERHPRRQLKVLGILRDLALQRVQVLQLSRRILMVSSCGRQALLGDGHLTQREGLVVRGESLCSSSFGLARPALCVQIFTFGPKLLCCTKCLGRKLLCLLGGGGFGDRLGLGNGLRQWRRSTRCEQQHGQARPAGRSGVKLRRGGGRCIEESALGA